MTLPIILPDRQGIYDFPFTKIVTGDTSYFTAHIFCFQGTDLLGAPEEISIICGWIDNTTQSVRIYDITNNQVICERTDITTEFPVVEDMGTISNLTAAPALWEVQMKRPQGGPAREVAVASMHMRF
jgi:hypothetical protein